jgi:type IV pilus assembly protein PilM
MTLKSLTGLFSSFSKSIQNLSKVKPKDPKSSIGIDIGSSSIKMVALGQRGLGGNRPLLGHHCEKLTDLDEAKLIQAIKSCLSSIHAPIKNINFSVSGQLVIMRVIEMPSLGEAELRQALPFEAQRHLPFNVQDVVLDGAILGPSDANKTWVLLAACKKELVESRINLIKHAGLEPAAIDIDAIALSNSFISSANGQKLTNTYALLNIGAQWTNLSVLKGKSPYLVRDIPWGFEKLARQIAEQLGKDEPYIFSQLKPNSNPAPEIIEAMKNSCESLTTDLQLSFDFFENRFGTPPEQIIVSGGASLCPGFIEALKTHLAQSLTLWSFGPPQLSPQFAVAYGIALHGLSE